MKKTIDPHWKQKPPSVAGIDWYLPAEKPLRMTGLYWYDREFIYKRFTSNVKRYPENYQKYGPVMMSWNSAGVQCAFRSDSTKIVVKARLAIGEASDHMAQTGSSGFDLYATDNNGKMRFVGVTRNLLGAKEFSTRIFENFSPNMRSFIINFPLYDSVEEVYIGVDSGSKLEAPLPWNDERPIVAYGTSITQGGCAERPGMAYTNILSRLLNMPVYNFGFSGCGWGEAEVADMLTDFENPALFILDYEVNTGTWENYAKTLTPFIDILRKKHPDTPIMVLSCIRFGIDNLALTNTDRIAYRQNYVAVSQAEVARRAAAGDKNIYFFDGRTLLGEDWDECTVDCTHPTALGFYRMAHGLLPAVREYINWKDGIAK